MPFDTISAPPQIPDRNSIDRPQVWACHLDKPKELPSRYIGSISVSIITASILFTTYGAFTKPYTEFVTAKKYNAVVAVKGAITTNPDPTGTLSELVKAGLKPLSFEAKPMATVYVPRAVKRGGFDDVYKEAGKKYGVPWQILAAVHSVETGQSGDTGAVSSAGALGPMQFMSATFNAYAQDGDGDGAKLVNDVHDAIYTAAKHLAVNGASRGNLRQALYNYNHSNEYVEKVLNRARDFGYSG